MDDFELNSLFAQARQETAADADAAERFLARHRAARAQEAPAPARPRAGWWSWTLAGAAVLTGLLAARPAPALPASAAYDTYHGVLGEGW